MRISDWSSDVCSSDLYNVCPHRGSQIVRDDMGSQNSFTCPFHSWQFDLDGKNTRVTDAETFRPDVLCHDKNLSSVRVEEAAGLVFMSMADDVQSLAVYMGTVLQVLGLYEFDQMYVGQHKCSDW